MADVKLEIHGLAELEQKLREESKKLAVRTIRSAARKAGKIWEEAIKARAPRDTGFLVEHVGIRTSTTSGNEGNLHLKVGFTSGERKKGKNTQVGTPFYAVFQEYGAQGDKHKQPARPFVRPAFEETKQQVLDVFIEELRKNLNDLGKK